MPIGFKKSLFGFNCSDVIDYIERTHNSFVQKENKLNLKVEELTNELSLSKELQEKLEAEKNELNQKLDEFNAKYEEIERLSENIGKLYLVAQTNAKAIIQSSENSVKITSEEVNKNLFTIDKAHESLTELRLKIAKTSDDFIAEVENLMSSLSTTREQLATNTNIETNAKNEFETIYESIINA